MRYFSHVARFWNEQTLKPKEVIVVDYGCPEGVGDWVEQTFPGWIVVRVTEDTELYNRSRARNCGGVVATGEAIFFADADVCPCPDMIERYADALLSGYDLAVYTDMWVPGGWYLQRGTCLVYHDLYHQVRGYDETYIWYGYEDPDFHDRCEEAGGKRKLMFNPFTMSQGGPEDRHEGATDYSPIKDTAESLRVAGEWYKRRKERGLVNPGGYGRCE